MSRLSVTLLSVVLLSTPALSAQQSVPPPGYKDPNTATLFSVIVPGGGQLYSGETGKGLTLLGIGLVAPIAGAIISTDDVLSCTGLDCTVDQGTMVPLYVGVAVALGAWIYGIADASTSARKMNEQNGVVAFLHEHVTPLLESGPRETRLGFRVALPNSP